MKLFRFGHDGLKAGCCNNETSTTYWLAETKEQAEREIKREDGREPHGLCGICMADMLIDEGYEITKVEK